MGCATVAAVFVSTQQVARGKTHKGRGTLAVDIWRGPLTLHCPLPQSIAHSVILSCFFFLSHFGVLGGAINRKRFPFVTHWIYRASPRSPPLRMGFLFYSLERALAKKNVGLTWLSAAFWPHCFKSVREGGIITGLWAEA